MCRNTFSRAVLITQQLALLTIITPSSLLLPIYHENGRKEQGLKDERDFPSSIVHPPFSSQKSLLVAIGTDGVAIDFTSSHTTNKPTENLVGGYWPGVHLFPSRTEKLSPEPPMILGSNLVK